MTGEDMLKGTDIDVDVDDGVVKLKGNVRDQATRERAVTLARDTEGVLKVIDELKVR
jgi:osmotically-inducible protein OsmY